MEQNQLSVTTSSSALNTNATSAINSENSGTCKMSEQCLAPSNGDTNFAECSSIASSTDHSIIEPYQQKWIKLNVGGQHFVTTTSTLSKYPKSFLFRLCQEHPDLNSEKVSAMESINIS